MATDGGLTERGKQISFVSSDPEQLTTFLGCLPRRTPRRYETHERPRTVHRTLFKDATIYRWLLAAGLTPRKSLTIGALSVPEDLTRHVVRGLLDGDGSIVNTVGRYGSKASGEPYYWECLVTKFHSASLKHLHWLRERLNDALGIRGHICIDRRKGNDMYSLRYAKRESQRLLPWLYADRDAPCLMRKRSIWDNYRRRHGMDGASVARDDRVARVAEPG